MVSNTPINNEEIPPSSDEEQEDTSKPKIKRVVKKKSNLDLIKEEFDKFTKEFFESSALFDELVSIYKKGERDLK
jgi:hypothetical protein